jgi:peptidoglycan/xylan/chitin deacetylase (PgdA/CDA1 family)
VKRAARLVLTHPFFVRVGFALSQRAAPIFTLHRFRDEEAGTAGHDPRVLRANLKWLRSHNVSVLSLTELLDRLAEGAPIRRAVAFIVDDGYADFARVAAPIFSEFDCPVTVFLTTGFLDGRQWMWWDIVRVALTALGREADVGPMILALKRIPESERLDRVRTLIQDSGVDLPSSPPVQYAPIKWDEVRRLARSGVTFGPHSVTHPVLSQTDDDQSNSEIAESWRRVRDEAGDAAVHIFCYPDGRASDFSQREQDAVAAAGMRAALSTEPGYTSHRDFAAGHPSNRFRLPRFPYSEDQMAFILVASGIERAKRAVRTAIGHGRP